MVAGRGGSRLRRSPLGRPRPRGGRRRECRRGARFATERQVPGRGAGTAATRANRPGEGPPARAAAAARFRGRPRHALWGNWRADAVPRNPLASAERSLPHGPGRPAAAVLGLCGAQRRARDAGGLPRTGRHLPANPPEHRLAGEPISGARGAAHARGHRVPAAGGGRAYHRPGPASHHRAAGAHGVARQRARQRCDARGGSGVVSRCPLPRDRAAQYVAAPGLHGRRVDHPADPGARPEHPRPH
mmetsp:Transcript_1575/g.4294  ORF Transcript_1575/g.4294 Transcript_1575/m.4294 type:complete len:245 (-) Transcript_1575:1208-1942(-)